MSPPSLVGNEKGVAEALAATIVLSAVVLGILSLEVVTRTQLMIALHAKRKVEFEAVVRQVTYSLSDPRTCYANLHNRSLNSDLRTQGFSYYSAVGAQIGTFIGTDGKADLFELDTLRVTNAVPVLAGSSVHLAEIELVAHYATDPRTFNRKIPLYVELAGSQIQACYVSGTTLKGSLTVEQKTCKAIAELEAIEKYGTPEQCEVYLVKKTIADGDRAAASLAGP